MTLVWKDEFLVDHDVVISANTANANHRSMYDVFIKYVEDSGGQPYSVARVYEYPTSYKDLNFTNNSTTENGLNGDA